MQTIAIVVSLLFGVTAVPQTVYAEEIALTPGVVETIITPEPVIVPLTIEEKIIVKAVEYGYSPTKALAIAWAESRYQNIPNSICYDGEQGVCTAYGIFQFTRTTYKAFCGPPEERMDIDKNIDCAVRMLSEGGESHWSESSSSWGKIE